MYGAPEDRELGTLLYDVNDGRRNRNLDPSTRFSDAIRLCTLQIRATSPAHWGSIGQERHQDRKVLCGAQPLE